MDMLPASPGEVHSIASGRTARTREFTGCLPRWQ